MLKSFYTEWKLKNSKNRVYMLAGGLFLLIALASIFIPILPQIPFAVAAAYFFSKGSLRMHLWIRHHKLLGPPVRDWEDFKIVRPKVKIISTLMMIGGAVIAHVKWGEPWAYMIDFVMLVSIAYICTRRSKLFSIPLV